METQVIDSYLKSREFLGLLELGNVESDGSLEENDILSWVGNCKTVQELDVSDGRFRGIFVDTVVVAENAFIYNLIVIVVIYSVGNNNIIKRWDWIAKLADYMAFLGLPAIFDDRTISHHLSLVLHAY
jgi:hypothetical protein